MEEALFSLLYDTADIRELVDDRIWPLERKQGVVGAGVTYQRAGGTRDYDMEGATGLVESRYFINVWVERAEGRDSKYKVAKLVARRIVARFSPVGGFRETVGKTEIQGIFINNEDDTRADGATGVGVARVFLDCTFWHKES
jgi:hypothetical protein